MNRLLPAVFCLLFLAACSDSQTDVFDRNGIRKGHVTINGSISATISNRAGSIVGEVRESTIYNRAGSKVGEVQDDGDIENRGGSVVGRIEGERCETQAGSQAGYLSKDIDDEAAAGACLLLLLLQ